MSNTEKKNILTKEIDFAGWFRYMLIELESKGMVDENGRAIILETTGSAPINQERNIFIEMMRRIHADVIATIPTRIKTGTALIKYLTETRLGGNRYELEIKYNEFRMLAHQRDAQKYIDELEKLETKIVYAGGSVNAREKYAKMTSHLNVQLYAPFITQIRSEFDSGKKEITEEAVIEIRERLIIWSRCMPQEYEKDRKEKVFMTNSERSKFQERECTICKERIPEKKIRFGKIYVFQTHDTKDHKEGNKGDFKAYSSPILLDTCASTHLCKDIPKVLNTKERGIVKGSVTGTESARIIGTGDFQAGELRFTANIAPRLDANLLSAGKLIKEGYAAVLKRNIKPGIDLEIKKDGNTIATGQVTSNNMLQINEPITELEHVTRKSQSFENHVKFAHLGKCECSTCMEAKRRKSNINKGKRSEVQPLEKISVDIQGPLSIKGIDGSRYNLKIVDAYSKYVTVIPTLDKSSKTTANIYDFYIKHNERKVGRKIKYTMTDGGTEFYGEFLDLIAKQGIQKIRGEDHEHSYPIDAENANGILNRLTRSNLLQSKLPAQYWPYALKHACYSYNREGNESPYERLYNRKPRTDHMHGFGIICYAWKPKERRNFKFEPVREKCRFLGYADDDEPEIINGYIVMRESDRSIFFSKDVIFPKTTDQISPLSESNEEPTLEDLYVIDNPADYDYEESDVEDNSTQQNIDSNQTNLELLSEINEGPAQNTRSRRQAMTEHEIQRIRQDTSDTESSDDYFHTAANNTMPFEDDNESEENECNPEIASVVKHSIEDDPISSEEYEEIWNSAFSRYDIVHQCYRTHKQDPSIPQNYRHLMKMKQENHPEYKFYKEAMEIEEANMEEQEVYSKREILKEIPKDRSGKTPHFVDSTWAFAKQYDEKGKLLKYKARLCGRGFREIHGIDYDEVYSPTVKQKLVRAIVAIAASKNWKIYQDDCKAAYLNAVLEKGKWLKLPNGHFVFIRKCLYGLKESAREWFKLVKSYLISLGFHQNPADPCTFFKLDKEKELDIVLALFVDDTLTTGKETSIQEFRHQFRKRFRVSDKGGICKHFLSIGFSEDDQYIYMDQSTYIKQKLTDYSQYLGNPMQGCATALLPNFQEALIQAENSQETEPNFPYRELVGSLVYASNGTRFDITAAVSIVSRFANEPKKIHCDMVRRIYHYLRANPRKLKFKKGGSIKLVGYCDSSLGNLEDYSSLAGFCFTLGDTIISWKSFREPVKALSTAEAEYLALTPAVQECIYLQQFLNGLGYQTTKTEIHEDNQACIALAKNPQDKKRTRHIQIRFHWIRDQLEQGVFTLIPTRTFNMLADLFTKGLHGPQLRTISFNLGLVHDSAKQGENEIIDASQTRSRSTSESTLSMNDVIKERV